MSCTDCRGFGFVFTAHKEDESKCTVVFRCQCSQGRAKPQTGIPLYSPEYRKFYPLYDLLTEAAKATPKEEPKVLEVKAITTSEEDALW